MELWPAGRLWWSMGTVIIGAPRTTAPYPYGDSGCEPLAVDRGSARGGKRMKYDEGGSWRDVACRRRSRRKQRRERVDQGRTGAARARAGRRAVRRASRGRAARAREKRTVIRFRPDRGRATAGGPRRTRTTAAPRRGGHPAGTGPAWDDVDDPTTRTRRTRAAARRGARRAARAVNRRPRVPGSVRLSVFTQR